MTSETIDVMLEKMKLTGDEDEAQVNVKRAVQIVLKTARQVYRVPLGFE